MKIIGCASRRVVAISAILLAATVLLGLVPWRLVAGEPRQDKPTGQPPSPSSPLRQTPPVAAAPKPDQEEKKFVPFATFEFHGGRLGSGGGTLQSGFTVVELNEDAKAHRTSMAISLAYDMRCNRMPTYRAAAMDKRGRTFVSEGGSCSGGGEKLGVITLICTFPLAVQDIDKIVIERLQE